MAKARLRRRGNSSRRALEPGYVVIGGANVARLDKLPPEARRGDNTNALKGRLRPVVGQDARRLGRRQMAGVAIDAFDPIPASVVQRVIARNLPNLVFTRTYSYVDFARLACIS